MADPTTKIIITAQDQTKAAFDSVSGGLVGLSSRAVAAGAALSAIGGGALVGTMAAFAKETINAQDELFKLSQKTGIAVESLAGLEFAAEQSGVELDKVAKATRAFTLLVAESADETSEAAKKLSQLGLSYKNLKDLSPEKQLLALADALSKFSKEDKAVALTATLGQKMADLIPLLAGGSKNLAELIDQGKKFNPVTEQSARQAEIFNDQLNVLSKSVSSLGRELVQGMIPGLSAVADRMANVTQQSGFLAGALAGVKELFTQSFGNPKILGDVGNIRREIFKTQEVIATLSAKKDSVFFDKNALAHEQEKLVQLEIDLQAAIVKSREVIAVQDASAESTKKFAIALDAPAEKLNKVASAQDLLKKAQTESLRVEEEYIKLLLIERRAREDLLRPYQQSAKAAEDRLDAMRQENAAMQLSQQKQISLEHAIELTTIARLEEKKAITTDTGIIDAINKEIAARNQIIGAIKTSEDRTKQLASVTRNTTDEVSQLWMQAGRNIQSSLATGIFNFFDDGLKGMLKNVISTVGRIASEFAALKLAQNVGLSSMFAGGVGGTGSSALSLASAGSNALSAVRGGFGLNSLVGGGLSRLGGSIGAFGGGLAGSSAGVFSGVGGAGTAFIGGPGTALGGSGLGAAAGLGSSVASLAGPVAALAAGFLGGKMIAGQNKIAGIGGTEAALIGTALGGPVGAVVAGAILKLFGRGPFKFRQQSLQGTISDSGLDGDITNVERAKGGVFRSNAHRSTSLEIPQEIQQLLDTTISGFYKSTHEFAVNMGLSTSLVDNFTKEIQIKSEKGKTITAEAIQEMLGGIGNDIAKNLLPTVDTFKRLGEDSLSTLTRLNTEFVSLREAAINLGASADYAKELVGGLGIATRTAYVEAAGGADELLSLTARFNANFLTEAEQMAPKIKFVEDGLRDLGIAADITKDGFGDLIQAMALAGDANAVLLLQYQDLFLEVDRFKQAQKADDGSGSLATKRQDVNDALLVLQQSADRERDRLTKNYNDSLSKVNERIADVTGNISRLRGLSDALKQTINTLNPVSLDDARAQVSQAIAQSQKGGIVDLDALKPALDKLAESNTAGFSTRNEFLRSQGVSTSLVTKLQGSNDKQLSVAERSLRTLETTKNNLDKNFELQLGKLDLMVTAAENETKAISGLSDAVLSLVNALGGFNQAVGNAGGSPIDTPLTGGNPSISSKDIINFANTHTPIETYKEAIKRGVSSDQIVASGKYSRAEIDKFLKDNKLPSFDVGGIVPKTSLALVHKGERVINPQQNEAIVILLQELLTAAKGGANYSKSVYDLLRNMTTDGTALNTRTAA